MEKINGHPQYQSLAAENVLKLLESDAATGLSKTEALRRLAVYGTNKISRTVERSGWLILISQFRSPVVYLLLFAAGLSLLFKEWSDGMAILLVILINAAIGFFLELQAERSMNALKALTAVPAKVLRGGQLIELDSVGLVPGDIVYAEAGDMITADARILRDTQLQADESTLTGESVPVEKQNKVLPDATDLPERSNLLFKGTHITKGNVWAVVTATGMQTELGKVAALAGVAEKAATPIEKKLEVFSKKLIMVTLCLVVIIFIAGLLHGQKLIEMTETAIALSVAAIPEGLPIVATLALARGMLMLARRKVIVKNLASVETLGGTSVICTDKTGTLTENKMTVSEVITGNITRYAANMLSSPALVVLRRIAVLCNTADIRQEGGSRREVGDPLETALLIFAEEGGEDIDACRQQFPKIKEEPFSSETRIMATTHKQDEGFILYAKGAAEEIMQRCSLLLKDEEAVPFTDVLKKQWGQHAETMAASGLRVIAGAFREVISEEEIDSSSALTFAGLYGLMDPLRPDVYPALEECRQAGIKVVMITGDHPSTARNIAMQLGIADEHSDVVVGQEMGNTGQQEPVVSARWKKAAVFARVSPAQKLELIRVLQEDHNVVGWHARRAFISTI